MKRHRRTLVLTGMAAAVLMAASFAWACQPQPYIALSPDSGPSGTTVSVTGQNFQEGSVELRWNSANGHLLGTTSGPQFVTEVTIPESGDGTYVVMAVQYQENGDFRGQPGRAPFTVASEAPESPPPPETPPEQPERPEEKPERPQERPDRPPVSSGPSEGGSGGPVPRPVQPPQVVVTGDGDRAFAGSVAPSDRRGRADARAPQPVDPSAQSAGVGGAELWSGFSPEDGSGPALGAETSDGGLGWQAFAGVVALGLGSVLLLAGSFVVMLQRRKVRVRAEDHS